MSGTPAKVESTAFAVVSSVENAFESIPARLKSLATHVEAAIAYPFTPDPVKQALPLLLGVLGDLHQEVAELRVPCPCKPASTAAIAATDGAGQASASTTGVASDAAPAAPITAADLAAKWPTYDDQLAAFTAGQMDVAEAAAFAPVHAKVVAFAASLNS